MRGILGGVLIAIACVAAADEIEQLLWDSIRDSDNATVFQAYLAEYPQGTYAEEARTRIQALGGEVPVVAIDPSSPLPSDLPTASKAAAASDPLAVDPLTAVDAFAEDPLATDEASLLPATEVSETQEDLPSPESDLSQQPIVDEVLTSDVEMNDQAQPASESETLVLDEAAAEETTEPPPAENPHAAALAQARNALEANRLATPADNSVMHWAGQILAVDSEQPEALALMRQALQRYLDWTASNLARERVERAASFLNRAEAFLPYGTVTQRRRKRGLDAELVRVRTTIAQRRAAEEAAQQALLEEARQRERENQRRNDEPFGFGSR